MRRIAVSLFVAVLMLVPATSASGTEHDCPALSGTAKLDFGRTMEGKAKLVYDGEKIKVDFVETAFVPEGVFFDWFFPGGTVSIVEHATVTPLTGRLVAFNSTIEVLDGGTGTWTWSGVANPTAGWAHIQEIEGTLCIGDGGGSGET